MTPKQRFEENSGLVYYIYKTKFSFDVRNNQWQEDIKQEGFLALWKACLAFQEEKAEFSTFAYKVIYNAMLSYITRKVIKHMGNSSLEAVLLENEKGDTIEIQDIIPAPDPYLEKDLQDLVKITFGKCSQQVQLIVQKTFEGYKQEEIANMINKTQPVVSRSLKKFKRILKQQMEAK